MAKFDQAQEAAIRYELEKFRALDDFERRVEQLKKLIIKNHKFDWPYTSAFDDGGIAYHEAKRRIAEDASLLRNSVGETLAIQ